MDETEVAEVNLTENVLSTDVDIERVFSEYIDDAHDVSQEQFDDCIRYSKEKGWERWESAFKQWKKEGKIPFIDEHLEE